MAGNLNILIAEAQYYEDIAGDLRKGALEVLQAAGVSHTIVSVPGTFEVPAAIRFAIRAMELGAASQRYAGFIALGCVVRGETDHYDHICREASRALMDITINYSVAMGFGILICETIEQARVRADPAGRNKGGEAARACLSLIDTKKDLRLVVR
ncbi:MAG: 6,7-dimethyl-8-ribityllumazine synthase [Rhodospirillales bacterium]|jgi:6,7-dimethyl-8-ribityllumazine synthase|nr:6,7-dimethyl-8-ribityllumazine synthase [Rhodospirillales bacterium]